MRGHSASCRIEQCIEQGIDLQGLGLHQPEARQERTEVLQNLAAPSAAGLGDEFLDHTAQIIAVDFHGLGGDAVDVHQFVVVVIDEDIVEIEHEREAAGHTRAEVEAGRAEHDFRCLLICLIILFALEKKTPIKINGIPKPSEYANSRLNATEGVVAASVSIVPRIGPTHGVHPAAKANPKRNDIR